MLFNSSRIATKDGAWLLCMNISLLTSDKVHLPCPRPMIYQTVELGALGNEETVCHRQVLLRLSLAHIDSPHSERSPHRNRFRQAIAGLQWLFQKSRVPLK